MREVILAIDCSNRWTCLGLSVVDEEFPAEESFSETVLDLGRRQASQLPNAVAELLEQNALKLSDITLIAVAVGPGYFTGIRIGMAYAAALAFALGVDVVPLSSLEIVLRSFHDWKVGVKAPLMAASRELAFSSVWRDGVMIREEKERTREELCGILNELSAENSLYAVTDARLFAATGADGVKFIEKPDGAAMARLALERRNERVKPNELRARYLREPGLGRSL